MQKPKTDISNNTFVKIQRQLFGDFLGGPKLIPFRYVINF